MKSFILMFPFQTASISFPEGSFIFPGSSIDFLGKIQNAAPDIDVLFHEHSPLEAEEIADFKKHQSLYFLKGSFKRSEEHTSELQSRPHLVCRLLLEKKKKKKKIQ